MEESHSRWYFMTHTTKRVDVAGSCFASRVLYAVGHLFAIQQLWSLIKQGTSVVCTRGRHILICRILCEAAQMETCDTGPQRWCDKNIVLYTVRNMVREGKNAYAI
jgi:hypothetical protein